MCMEMLLQGAKDTAEGRVLDGGIIYVVLALMKVFTDDVTILVESRSGTEQFLTSPVSKRILHLVLDESEAQEMSQSLHRPWSSQENPLLHWSGDQIPTVKEQPVKSVGCWYSIPFFDCYRGTKIEKTAREALTAINETDLPRTLAKGLDLPTWPPPSPPVAITDLRGTLTRVEAIPDQVNKYLTRWLRVPPSFTSIGLYNRSTKAQLPISSVCHW